MKKIFKDKKRLAVIFSLLGFSLLFISQKQAFFQKTFAQSSLRTCSEIAQGYDFHMCSTMTTTGFGCGPASDPERNNICYSQIQIAQSSDCQTQGLVCRYYNRETCGTTNSECSSRCTLKGCLSQTPTATPTPPIKTSCIPRSYTPTCGNKTTSQKYECVNTRTESRTGWCSNDSNLRNTINWKYKSVYCKCQYRWDQYLCDGRYYNKYIFTGSFLLYSSNYCYAPNKATYSSCTQSVAGCAACCSQGALQ